LNNVRADFDQLIEARRGLATRPQWDPASHGSQRKSAGRVCRNLSHVPWWPGSTCRWILTPRLDHRSQARQETAGL